MKPLVTCITGTTGRKELQRNIESVANQTYDNIRHLIFVDGEEAQDRIANNQSLSRLIERSKNVDIINLPYSVGKDRWNSHRMYAAGTYIADGEYVIYLDDDNTLDPEHVQSCYYQLESSSQTVKWSYSLRKIVTVGGEYLCNDDCESLGNWASVCHKDDYFIDVNCYFLPKQLAIYVSPVWYRKFREPGQPEVDRMLCHQLRNIVPGFCTGQYTVNYAVASNSELSVKPEFFTHGNVEMLKRYNGVLPWKK